MRYNRYRNLWTALWTSSYIHLNDTILTTTVNFDKHIETSSYGLFNCELQEMRMWHCELKYYLEIYYGYYRPWVKSSKVQISRINNEHRSEKFHWDALLYRIYGKIIISLLQVFLKAHYRAKKGANQSLQKLLFYFQTAFSILRSFVTIGFSFSCLRF